MRPLFEETWFHAPVEREGTAVPLSDEETHHAQRVLRLSSGAEVLVSNGTGSVFRARLEFSGDGAVVHALERMRHEPEPGLSLAIALLKGREVEAPVEAACEFALRDVFLLKTDHSAEFRDQDFDRLLERLRQKSVAALKQAKKAWLTRIHSPEDLRAWRERHRRIPLALAHPGEDTVPSPHPKEMHVLTGPEGGFSESEVEYLLSQENCHRLSLGPTRLRAVHAPIAALGNLSGRGI
jgi:16S rRNA (uracil1498-N3)-methyltransferase